MTAKDYIAPNYPYPDWLITAAEIATMVAFIWVCWEAYKLTVFFWNDKSKLARLKTNEFLTDALTAILTVFMGLALYFNWQEGVKTFVIIRPIVGVLNAIALRRLYNHFRGL